MYDDSDEDSYINRPPSSENQRLLAVTSYNDNNINSKQDSGPDYFSDDIDVVGLRIYCEDRIQMIQNDLNDPSLTQDEKLINRINLASMNKILTNVRLNEKIKMGSLQNDQYTDAVMLQKQVVCNLAAQREYGEIIKPVVITQPQVAIKSDICNEPGPHLDQSNNTMKSILKHDNHVQKNNALTMMIA